MSVREPWVKIAARMPSNQKVRGVSIPARWCYTASICYAGANLTDGFVPEGSLTLVDGNKKLAAELTAGGLWDRVSGGWVIHDFLQWNRSRERVERTSDVRAEIGSLGGNKRWQNESKTDTKTEANSSLSASAPVEPLGSQPGDPLERGTDKKQKPSKLLATKKTEPTDEWVEEMREKYAPQLQDFTETLRFHAQGPYYKRVDDRQEFLEKKLVQAVEREKERRNGSSLRTNDGSRNGANRPPGKPLTDADRAAEYEHYFGPRR